MIFIQKAKEQLFGKKFQDTPNRAIVNEEGAKYKLADFSSDETRTRSMKIKTLSNSGNRSPNRDEQKPSNNLQNNIKPHEHVRG